MMHKSLQFPIALTFLATLHQAFAEDAPQLETEPFHYSQGFEDGTDPVQFWTSYKKKYTVNFKGITDERARSGKRSFKLDVIFDETSRFLWHIPMPRKIPATGDLQLQVTPTTARSRYSILLTGLYWAMLIRPVSPILPSIQILKIKGD